MARPRKVAVHLRFLAVITVAFVSTIFVGVGPAPAAAALPTQTLNLLGGLTSASLPAGSSDPFTEVSIDGGLTWGPAILSGPNSAGWATAAGTNSWLNCRSVVAGQLDRSCRSPDPTPQNALYALFRYKFWVPSDFQNATISGQMNADNEASVYFNGFDPSNLAQKRALGPIGGAVYWLPYNPAGGYGSAANIQNLLVAGWNTMYVALTDTGFASGINYNLTISIQSTTPMSVGAPGNTVTFDPQGGTVATASATVAPGASLSAVLPFPTPTRAGYVFDGWYTSTSAGVQATPTYATSTVPTQDLTLYARWVLEVYDVFYDEHGGSNVPDDTYSIGQTITLPTTSARPGFTFEGWFEQPSGGSPLGATYPPPGTGDITISARWSPPSSNVPPPVILPPASYDIDFNAQGGSAVPRSTYTAGRSIVLPPAPTRPGFVFVGWFTQPSGGTPLGATYAPPGTGAITIYAQWRSEGSTVESDEPDGSVGSDPPGDVPVDVELPVTGDRHTLGPWGLALSSLGLVFVVISHVGRFGRHVRSRVRPARQLAEP